MAIRKKVKDKNGNIIGYISAPSLDSLMNMSDEDIQNNIEPISSTAPSTTTTDTKPQMPALKSLGGSDFGEEPVGEGSARAVAGGLGALSSATFGIPEKIPGIKQTFEMVKERNPIAYGAGEVAGLFTPGGLPSLTSKGITKVAGKTLPKIAPKLGKVATSAITTGLEGAVQGGIETFIKTGKIDDTFKSAMTSAVLGAGAGAGMEAMAPVLKKISDRTLKKMLKGDEFADLNKNYGNLVDDLSNGKFGTNVRQAEEKIGKRVDDLNTQYENLISELDENITAGTSTNDLFDKVANKIINKELPELDIIGDQVLDKIEKLREAALARGNTNLTPKVLINVKRDIDKATNPFGKGKSLADASVNEAAGQILYKELLDEASQYSPKINEIGQKLKQSIALKKDMRDVINQDKAAANIHPIHLMIMFGSAMSMSPAKAPGFLISGAQVSKGLGRTMPGIVATKQLGEKLGRQTSQMDVGKLLGHLSGRAF